MRIIPIVNCPPQVVLLLLVTACAPNGSSAADANAESTPVSFRMDVMPIFQQSCALGGATCHGDQSTTPGGLRLDSADGGSPGQSVVIRIVGVRAAEDPMMNLITAGDPSQSFLMLKMDGTQATRATECAATVYTKPYPNCGGLMPQTSPDPLPRSTRDTVRAWIQQGAIDN